MEISTYFEPVSLERIGYTQKFSNLLGEKIATYTAEAGFPELTPGGLALIGVCEDRGAWGNPGCALAPDLVRQRLYPLAQPADGIRIADLGNIMPGQSLDDTYYAFTQVLHQLLELEMTVVILGGGQDLTFAAYKAYEILGRIVNITAIDSRFDLDNSTHVNSRSYLNHIIMQQPNFLFGFSNIGYQTYFVGANQVQLMKELKFDAYRLGEITGGMDRAEALLRNADIVSVDINAVRQSDAPAQANPSPHGFYGEQLCQMARFAGMSDKNSCFGIFELNPTYDQRDQTAHMVAHALWYYIEGFFNRKNDYPNREPQHFRRFIVDLKDDGMEIVFHKSKKTDRWWMEVPCESDERKDLYSRQLLIPCTYGDYLQAMENDVPELWWTYYHRIND